jgi:hypothetical protein
MVGQNQIIIFCDFVIVEYSEYLGIKLNYLLFNSH